VPLLDRNGWKPDDYVRANEAAAADAVIVPLDALDAALAARRPGQRLGVAIPNSISARSLALVQPALDLIAVDFPLFRDGRGFSIARALRRHGYQGVLRASGNLIADQFAFALHCGFDEVEISDANAKRQPLDQWLSALEAIDLGYQSAADRPLSILAKRRAAA
jgi:uncharacterized protein (DUF934 family)